MIPDPDLRARFLAGMSHAAATVNVVTTDGPGGRAGVTVSAMSSVSADTARPTLLICVHHKASAAAALLENGVFCVNVLRDDQSWISDTFAGRFRDQIADKFDCADWTSMSTGALRVVDPLVAFDCRVAAEHRVGTHHVFFGEVEDIFVAGRGSPLIYARRAYGAASPIEGVSSIGEGRAQAANRLVLGCFHAISAFTLPGLFSRLSAEHPEMEVQLIEGDQSRLHAALASGEAELALLYDLGLAEGLEQEVLSELQPYALMSAGHRLAQKGSLMPEDFVGQPMILLNTPPSPDYFVSLLRDQGVEPKVALRSDAIETVRGMVGHGLGISLLATRPVTEASYDGKPLAVRSLGWPVRSSRVVLAHRAGERLSPAAMRFARLCRAQFGTAVDRSFA